MTRIDDTFARLRASGKKAFVSYIMAGDPDVPRALAALRQNGVAVCEEEGLLRLPPMEDERLAALVCALADSGAGVVGVNKQTRRLEEIFLSLTQNGGEAV